LSEVDKNFLSSKLSFRRTLREEAVMKDRRVLHSVFTDEGWNKINRVTTWTAIGLTVVAFVQGEYLLGLLMYPLAWTGTWLNKLVVSRNGGKMPIGVRGMSLVEMRSSQIRPKEPDPHYCLIAKETKLFFLGDIIRIPLAKAAMSIGDAFQFIGVGTAIAYAGKLLAVLL
jgi:hypothetical protein